VEALTPAERRGALLVAVLLALGAGHDLWRASRPLPRRETPGWTGAQAGAQAGSEAAGQDRSAARDPASADEPAVDSAPGPAPATTDLNRASARELDRLPGVGPVLAARIIDYRSRHGAFRQVEELMAVRGIGPRLYARLAPRVSVAGRDRKAPTVPPTAPKSAPTSEAP
jgi:competence ComEA-like helix-hairpin-helix protein